MKLIVIIFFVVINSNAYSQKYQKSKDELVSELTDTYPKGTYSFSNKDSCLTYVTNDNGIVWRCLFKNNKNDISFFVSLQNNNITLALWKSYLQDVDFKIKDDMETTESYYCIAKFGISNKIAYIEFNYK